MRSYDTTLVFGRNLGRNKIWLRHYDTMLIFFRREGRKMERERKQNSKQMKHYDSIIIKFDRNIRTYKIGWSTGEDGGNKIL